MSVVLSVYNGGVYLAEAVESVLAQTFADLELVAIDDGSTDGSGAVLDGYAARDGRVRVLHQKNRGVVPSLNRGISAARGELIARMDADDISLPDRIEKQVCAFDQSEDITLISSAFQIISADGSLHNVIDHSADEDLASWYLLFYNAVGGHSQVMFRRDTALGAGNYNVADHHAEDFGLWYRLVQRGRYVCLPDVLLHYRYHDESISRQNSEQQIRSMSELAQSHIADALGLSISIEDIRDLQAFWVTGAYRPFPCFPSAKRADRVHDILMQATTEFLETPAGQRLRSESVVKLRKQIARRFLSWAQTLPFRERRNDVLRLIRHSLYWDRPLGPVIAALVGRRALSQIRLSLRSLMRSGS